MLKPPSFAVSLVFFSPIYKERYAVDWLPLTLARYMIVFFLKSGGGEKGGSRLFSDFARIAISAAGGKDLEGRFSL
jgi:hypothetical protein